MEDRQIERIRIDNALILAQAPVPLEEGFVDAADLCLVAYSNCLTLKAGGAIQEQGVLCVSPETPGRESPWRPDRVLHRRRVGRDGREREYRLRLFEDESDHPIPLFASLVIPNIGRLIIRESHGVYEVRSLAPLGYVYHWDLDSGNWRRRGELTGDELFVNGNGGCPDDAQGSPGDGSQPEQVDDGGLPWPPK